MTQTMAIRPVSDVSTSRDVATDVGYWRYINSRFWPRDQDETPIFVRPPSPKPATIPEWLAWIEERPNTVTGIVSSSGVAETAAYMVGALLAPTVRTAQIRERTTAHEAPRRLSRDYAAFKELVHWLRSKDQDVAAMIGVRRTTAYAWEREGYHPRPAVARRLYQAHGLVAALTQHLGSDVAFRWLSGGDRRRRERLLSGDFDSVQREAHQFLFAPVSRRPRPGSWVPDDIDDEQI